MDTSKEFKPSGIPVLPSNARSWTFYRVWGKITESSTGRVWKEGVYWTAYPQFIDSDYDGFIDRYGRVGICYDWEWEILSERRGIPPGYVYSTMRTG